MGATVQHPDMGGYLLRYLRDRAIMDRYIKDLANLQAKYDKKTKSILLTSINQQINASIGNIFVFYLKNGMNELINNNIKTLKK